MNRTDLARLGASAGAWAALGGITATGIGAVMPAYRVLRRFDPDRLFPHRLTNLLWGGLLLSLPPWWSVRVRGLANLPTDGPFLLCANHQSFVDVLALHALRVDFKWVLHGRFERIPGFGAWIRNSGYVAVDPTDPVSGRRMLDLVGAWFERGVPVALFPEGTRSEDGVVAPFKRGPFRAAIRAGVPVVPVAVDGTRPILPKHRCVAQAPPPWSIRVSVLPPLWAHAGERAPSMARACRAALVDELDRLRGPGMTTSAHPHPPTENG